MDLQTSESIKQKEQISYYTPYSQYKKDANRVLYCILQLSQKLLNIVDQRANRQMGKGMRSYSKCDDKNEIKFHQSFHTKYNEAFN